MIVCSCRSIRNSDFKTEKGLKERIMKDDFNCGQCQMKYIIGENDNGKRIKNEQETINGPRQKVRY